MKVCIVGFGFTKDRKEGAKNYVYGLSNELSCSGHKVLIVTSGVKDQSYAVDGFRVTEVGVGASLGSFIASWGKLRNVLEKVLEKEKPDILYDHFVLPGTSLFVTVPLKLKFRKLRFIKEVYNKSLGIADIKKLFSPFEIRFIVSEGIFRLLLNNQLVDSVVFRFFNGLVYHSKGIGKQFSPLERRKSKEIPLGINLKNWQKKSELKKGKGLIISYLGHPSLKKGVNEFINASEILLEENSEISITMALSKIAEGESYYYKKVKGLEKKFPGKISLMGEVEPLDIYSSSSLLIFPLLHDWAAISPPLSLLEAMASSAIVMATKVNGMEDIIEDGKNGFIIDNLAPKAIAKTVEKNIKSIKKEIGKNAYKSMESHDWANVIPFYEEVFEK